MKQVVLSFLVFLVLSSPALSQSRVDANKSMDPELIAQFAARASRARYLESAGSHGYLGFRVGLASSNIKASEAESQSIDQQSLVSPTKPGSQDSQFTQLMVIKGTNWPLDFGGSVGQIAEQANFKTWSAFVQWTLYEALAMPAFSIRTSYGETFGLKYVNLKQFTVEPIIGYGFLRYFTVYASVPLSYYAASINWEEANDENYALLAKKLGTPSKLAIEKSWMNMHQIAGLQVALIPPFFLVAGEVENTSNSSQTYSFKFSVGL